MIRLVEIVLRVLHLTLCLGSLVFTIVILTMLFW